MCLHEGVTFFCCALFGGAPINKVKYLFHCDNKEKLLEFKALTRYTQNINKIK